MNDGLIITVCLVLVGLAAAAFGIAFMFLGRAHWKIHQAQHLIGMPLLGCMDLIVLRTAHAYERLLDGRTAVCQSDLEGILASYINVMALVKEPTDSAKNTVQAINRVSAQSPALMQAIKAVATAKNSISPEKMLAELERLVANNTPDGTRQSAGGSPRPSV